MRRHDDDAAEQGKVLAHLLGAVANLNDTMQQMSTGMKTRDGRRLIGAEAHPFQLDSVFPGQWLPGGPGVIVGPSSGVLLGVCARETKGVVTLIQVFDGTDAGGLLLWTGYLNTFYSETEWFPGGIAYTNGLFVYVFQGGVGGHLEGALYTSAGKIA